VLTAVSLSQGCVAKEKCWEDEVMVHICEEHTATGIRVCLTASAKCTKTISKDRLAITNALHSLSPAIKGHYIISYLPLTVTYVAPQHHASHSSLHFCQGYRCKK
jgi:hypothetical protein